MKEEEKNIRLKALQVANEEEMDEVRDMYDLYELSSRVHSKEYGLNRDFTLSWTNEAIENWANKQINITQNLYELVKEIDEKSAKKVRRFLLSEVLRRLVFTRSREGRTIKAILSSNSNAPTRIGEEKGVVKKWFQKAPNRETETEE